MNQHIGVVGRVTSFALKSCRHRTGAQGLPWRALSTSSLQQPSTLDTKALVNKCDENVFTSPFPAIPLNTKEEPYPPIYEFVTKEWSSTLKDRVAIRDGTTGQTRTFGQYLHTTQNLASALYDYFQIRPNRQTLAIFASNHVDYVPVSMAAAMLGTKLTPINPLFTVQELSTILQRSKSQTIFTDKARLDVVLEAKKECPLLEHVIILPSAGDDPAEPVPLDTLRLLDFSFYGVSFPGTVQGVNKAKLDQHTYLLPYSSGTTGLPKGVCLSHTNIVSNLLQCEMVDGPHFPSTAKLISPLPFFHIYGFLVTALYCGWKGQEIITNTGRFELETFCQLVQDHRPVRANLVPPILLALAKSPVVSNYDLSSLEQLVSAAAPLGPEIEKAVQDRLGPQCRIKQAWGMSELSPIGTINSDMETKSGTVGPLAPSTEGKIIDEGGNSLPPGQPGELLIRGPQVMLGYLEAPDKTAECLCHDSGWLRTGDVAMYDEDGYVTITDRLKELIKVRGYPVAPAELEALLLTHDHVKDVAVIQIPNDDSGELPRAYVVLKEENSVSEDEVKAWVKERVAPHKRLEGGVVFVDQIPKSASGKILRRILRDQLQAELELKQTRQEIAK